MEFNTNKTAIGTILLFLIPAVGAAGSPMTPNTVAMTLVGLALFSVLMFAFGLKHGEYRATR